MTRLKIVTGFFLMILAHSAVAQATDSLRMDTIEKKEEVRIYGQIQETKPMFRGGNRKLQEFIETHLVYPQEAIDAGVEGKVFIEFIIEKDGAVSNAKVLKGIGYGCDEEALRVVGLMPKWAPGRQRGECVRVRYTLPINFKLEDNQD